MSRPTGVTVIGCFFLAAGVYYSATGGRILLQSGGAVGSDEFAILSLVPYGALLVGLLCALVGWELLRLHDWARWAAQIMLAIGVAWTLPMMYYSNIHFGWRTLAGIAELTLRVLAIGYLFAPRVMDAFLDKRSRQPSSTASSPGR